MSDIFQSKMLKIRAVLLSTIVLTVLFMSFGCVFETKTGFPPLTTTAPNGTGPGETTAGTSQTSEPVEQLTLAMPLDNEGLEALRLLFLANKSGLIRQEPGQYIGLQILPDDLRQFDNGMILNLVPVPAATGATAEQIDLWQNSGNLPDIIYSRSAAETVGLAGCLDLSSYLYSNKLLTADRISIPALENCRDGARLYSIPYLASFPVLYINNILLMQLGLDMPARDWTWTDWQTFATEAQLAITQAGLGATPELISELSEDEAALNLQLTQALFVTDDLSSLLEWLPAAFDPTIGWATWDGKRFDFGNQILDDAAQWLASDYQAGHSTLHLSEEQRLLAFGSSDAIRSGRILMWAGDSADLDTWRQAGLQVRACMMPLGFAESRDSQSAVQSPDRIPISVRSLIVSSNSRLPGLAADLAAFIALDADALLMQSRYKLFSGLTPLINDNTVQQTLLAGQADWSWLLQFSDRLTTASCSAQQVNRGWNRAIAASLGISGPDLLRAADREERTAIIQNMIMAAQTILQED